ncbi:MAG: aminoacyl-tRNA hydrolase [Methylobacter sp.]|nr:aminoacyl-tRNA hydrolase [Methylobacter sp.]
MIKLIVGLGNPGQQYHKTRHNVGFLFLDHLIKDKSYDWSKEARFDGLISEVVIGGVKVILLKPLTFMNCSGRAVSKVARYYKLRPNEILVVHDELDFGLGVMRLKKDGGHAGHNGLRDIIAHLSSKEFYRLRIGIGRPPAGRLVSDYVLSDNSQKEMNVLSLLFDIGSGCVEAMALQEMSIVMNKMNSHKIID